MERKLVLNSSTVSKLLYYQVIYIFALRFCVDVLHFPSAISYGVDVINMLVTAFFLYSKSTKKKLFMAGMMPVIFAVIALIVFCFVDGITNMVKPQLFLWAFRNTMRYYPFFFSLVALWDEKMMDFVVKILLRLQYINFLIVLFQFFVLGYEQDYVGGIFGHTTGCNGALNIYLCIITALCIEKYIHKELGLFSTLSTVVIFLVSIVIAELKIGFIELPIILALAILLNKPSFKTVVATLVVLFMIPIGIQGMITLYPRWAYSFVDVGSFLGVGTEVGGGYNISRLGAFSDINGIFFHDDLIRNLFGFGFGNCEYSSIDIFTSSFNKRYGWLHYRWFAHQMWFLECCYLGIFFYALFFVSLFVWLAHQKRQFGDQGGFGSFGQIMIVICALSFIYNFTLRTEDGYMLYLALAIPCLNYRCVMEKVKKTNE